MQLLSAFFDILIQLFEFFCTVISDFILAGIPTRRKTTYDAEFGDPHKTFSHDRNDNGFFISNFHTDIKSSNSNLICIGPTGSSKSTNLGFNFLLQSHNFSHVVHDCSGEYFQGTSGALKAAGYEVLKLDYTSECSEGFNMISRRNCKSEQAVSKVIHTAMKKSQDGPADYWTQSGEMIANFFARVIWKYAPEEDVSIFNVIHTLNVFSYDVEAIDRWIVKIAKNDNVILSEYKSISATPSKTLLSSLSTAKTALAIYTLPHIQKLTSIDTIDFSSFRKKKVILYLCSSPSTAYLYRSISSTFLQLFFDFLLEKIPEKGSYNIAITLDEAAVCNINLSSFLSLSRKYRVSVQSYWQDLDQLYNLFGKHDGNNVFSNSRYKVIMPGPKSLDLISMLEKIMGRYSYVDEGTLQTKQRELLTANELYELDKILILDQKAILVDKAPFYENPKLLKLSKLPPVEIENKLSNFIPHLIQFD